LFDISVLLIVLSPEELWVQKYLPVGKTCGSPPDADRNVEGFLNFVNQPVG
jgi:hypothetical protein